MAVIHIVLFKFRKDTSQQILSTFVTELRKLRNLPSVRNGNLVVGGPSITKPIARSKGYDFCLLSYHESREALDEYQASQEHHDVTSKWIWPFNEDLTRFDFEVEDDGMGLDSLASLMLKSASSDNSEVVTPDSSS